MFVNEARIRVLYADTDKLGIVYYGNYPKYYEFGRTEAIRSIGMSYDEMEKNGIAMPVRDMSIQYVQPAYYDDLLTVKTIIKELPETRMKFYYEVYNQDDKLINKGETTLVFLDTARKRPTRAPAMLIDKMKPYFE